ncbi:hypothetical protein [Methanolobus sp. WCC4]|uniref:DUF4350 domain-containing protein n=1 Tax=Methanolobus sp. WCC4 TaxID=3125784 RepID=UPI0030F53FED
MNLKFIALIVSLLVSIFCPFVVSAQNVVFDNSAGFFGIDSYSGVGVALLADELRLEGYDVKETNDFHNVDCSMITDDMLNSTDILVLINPRRSFSFEEKIVVNKFVTNGKSLLLVCDNPESIEYANTLSSVFGAWFLPQYLGDVFINSTLGQMHFYSPLPIITDIEPDISIQYEGSAGDWTNRWIIPEKTYNSSYSILSGFNYGEGRIILLGDSDILQNENFNANKDFNMLVFDYLCNNDTDTKVSYSPDALQITTDESKKGIAYLHVKNTCDYNVTIDLIKPPLLDNIITINPQVIKLEPGQESQVILLATWNESYSSISDIIRIETDYGLITQNDYFGVTVGFL